MVSRCLNPKNQSFHNYGGRGITVCTPWLSFMTFMEWAKSNGYADDLTIDRIDNDGNYEPGNCQWIPHAENAGKTRNTRFHITAFGETKSAEKWVLDERCKVRVPSTIRLRIDAGWDQELAVVTPPEPKKPRDNLITAFGETKGIRDWIRDPRCVVRADSTLKMRVAKLGMEPEEALTKPVKRPSGNKPRPENMP